MMGYGPMAGLMWIWPVLALAGLAALGYLTYRLAQSPPSTAAASAARTILDERYARGEIDDEEYQRRRSALRTGA
ncbi:SHOCT domain-containing protein [Micromonospora sp. U56]|uniref:SHOCT domain-containing protein n=1 Tax=Micromonospora sp. U56 TaxID=2824900 RepID=UPI001B36A153|nr:SHOCT domain-containing protein [Micromonospora sp. U56]MBQ0892626.1 SHOCT domain-containing protein [Micromonospora sp. U56]